MYQENFQEKAPKAGNNWVEISTRFHGTEWWNFNRRGYPSQPPLQPKYPAYPGANMPPSFNEFQRQAPKKTFVIRTKKQNIEPDPDLIIPKTVNQLPFSKEKEIKFKKSASFRPLDRLSKDDDLKHKRDKSVARQSTREALPTQKSMKILPPSLTRTPRDKKGSQPPKKRDQSFKKTNGLGKKLPQKPDKRLANIVDIFNLRNQYLTDLESRPRSSAEDLNPQVGLSTDFFSRQMTKSLLLISADLLCFREYNTTNWIINRDIEQIIDDFSEPGRVVIVVDKNSSATVIKLLNNLQKKHETNVVAVVKVDTSKLVSWKEIDFQLPFSMIDHETHIILLSALTVDPEYISSLKPKSSSDSSSLYLGLPMSLLCSTMSLKLSAPPGFLSTLLLSSPQFRSSRALRKLTQTMSDKSAYLHLTYPGLKQRLESIRTRPLTSQISPLPGLCLSPLSYKALTDHLSEQEFFRLREPTSIRKGLQKPSFQAEEGFEGFEAGPSLHDQLTQKLLAGTLSFDDDCPEITEIIQPASTASSEIDKTAIISQLVKLNTSKYSKICVAFGENNSTDGEELFNKEKKIKEMINPAELVNCFLSDFFLLYISFSNVS